MPWSSNATNCGVCACVTVAKSVMHQRLCLCLLLLLPCRHTSDLVMLASFGSAQERNKQQFEALLAASGWKLLRVRPTSGIFMVVEAEPV